MVAILKAAEVGGRIGAVCRRHAISGQTFYRCNAKYGGMEGGDAARLPDREVLYVTNPWSFRTH